MRDKDQNSILFMFMKPRLWNQTLSGKGYKTKLCVKRLDKSQRYLLNTCNSLCGKSAQYYIHTYEMKYMLFVF